MANATPGPYRVRRGTFIELFAEGDADTPVATVHYPRLIRGDRECALATAALLAAAPEMRAALAELVAAARTVGAVWEQGDLAAAVRELVDLAETTAADYGLDPKETNECPS